MRMPFRTWLAPRLAWALALAAVGCAGKARNDVATPAAPPPQEVQMDPIKLHAVKGPDGVQHVETYDATELFERAGAALSDKRYDDSASAY